MSYAILRLTLTGTAPLLMANGRLADPLDPIAQRLAALTRKRHKTDADHEAIAEIEYLGSLWLADNQPCIPSTTIEAAFVKAARKCRLGDAARAGLICPTHAPLQYDGPKSPEALWLRPEFRQRAAVCRNGRRVMRTRPLFPAWAAPVALHYLPSLLNAREIVSVMELAGLRIGLGDWRPQFGRFVVAEDREQRREKDAAA